MLQRVIIAIVQGVVAWLICVIIGTLLLSLGEPNWAVAIGALLKTYAALIGLLVALWAYATSGTWRLRP